MLGTPLDYIVKFNHSWNLKRYNPYNNLVILCITLNEINFMTRFLIITELLHKTNYCNDYEVLNSIQMFQTTVFQQQQKRTPNF